VTTTRKARGGERRSNSSARASRTPWIRSGGLRAAAALLLAALAGAAAAGCRSEARSGAETSPPAAGRSDMRTAVFAVQGMTCTGCEIGVERALRRVPGVVTANADYHSGTARVEYDPSRARPEDLVAAIRSLGYDARPLERGD
jgi:copper chaperone CopZ